MDEMYNSDITDSEIDIPEIGDGNEGGEEEPTPPEVPEEPKSEIEVVNQFLEKYDYLSVSDAEDIYYQAYNTYLDLAFPLHYEITEIPEDRPRAIYWVKDCMKEIIDRNGITATSYKENGLSITWSTDMVSDILRARIVPLAVVRGSKK